MEESVLVGTKQPIDSIRHFIRDPSGVFSVCHLCECRIVQWRRDSSLLLLLNRPFPSSLVPLFQSESKCETILMNNDFDLHENETACRSHFHMKGFAINSFWNRGTRELGNSLLVSPYNKRNITRWFEYMNFIISWQEQYEILFLPLEHKIHIFSPPCNILYV